MNSLRFALVQTIFCLTLNISCITKSLLTVYVNNQTIAEQFVSSKNDGLQDDFHKHYTISFSIIPTAANKMPL